MSDQFEQKHPRGQTGRFTEKDQADPGGDVLAGQLPAHPELLLAETARLVQFAGMTARGYTREDVWALNRCLPDWMKVESAPDSSDLVGSVNGGPWRRISWEFNQYLRHGTEGDPVPQRLLEDAPYDPAVPAEPPHRDRTELMLRLAHKWFGQYDGDDCDDALRENEWDVAKADAWLARGLRVKTGYESLSRSRQALAEARQLVADGAVMTAVATIRQIHPKVARIHFENLTDGPTFFAFDADGNQLDLDSVRNGETARDLRRLGDELAADPELLRPWCQPDTFRKFAQYTGRFACLMDLDLTRIPE